MRCTVGLGGMVALFSLAAWLAQDSIHRRVRNHTNINTGMRKKPAARGGPRSLLHLSVQFYVLHKNPTQPVSESPSPAGL
eukprot:COSAG02_NODE_4044_length_5865_cov_133.321367_3_plen_80_part_00